MLFKYFLWRENFAEPREINAVGRQVTEPLHQLIVDAGHRLRLGIQVAEGQAGPVCLDVPQDADEAQLRHGNIPLQSLVFTCNF